jgi:hypothetical protein
VEGGGWRVEVWGSAFDVRRSGFGVRGSGFGVFRLVLVTSVDCTYGLSGV